LQVLSGQWRHRVEPGTSLHRPARFLPALLLFVRAIDFALYISLFLCGGFSLFGETV